MGSRKPGAGSGGGSDSAGSVERGRKGSPRGGRSGSALGLLCNSPAFRGGGSESSRSRSRERRSGGGSGSRSRSNRSRGSGFRVRVTLLGNRVSIVPAIGALLHPARPKADKAISAGMCFRMPGGIAGPWHWSKSTSRRSGCSTLNVFPRPQSLWLKFSAFRKLPVAESGRGNRGNAG